MVRVEQVSFFELENGHILVLGICEEYFHIYSNNE